MLGRLLIGSFSFTKNSRLGNGRQKKAKLLALLSNNPKSSNMTQKQKSGARILALLLKSGAQTTDKMGPTRSRNR